MRDARIPTHFVPAWPLRPLEEARGPLANCYAAPQTVGGDRCHARGGWRHVATQHEMEVIARLYPDGDPELPDWTRIQTDLLARGHSLDSLQKLSAAAVISLLATPPTIENSAPMTATQEKLTKGEFADIAKISPSTVSKKIPDAELTLANARRIKSSKDGRKRKGLNEMETNEAVEKKFRQTGGGTP